MLASDMMTSNSLIGGGSMVDTWIFRIGRSALMAVLAAVLIGAAALGVSSQTKTAHAWPAGSSASNTLVGLNWNDWQFASFPYTVNSNIAYTKVWAGYGYTRIDSLTHETKTNNNWWSWAGYLSGSISTTFYSDSYYLFSYGMNLNGSCIGPTWTFWMCDHGTVDITVLGHGYGYFTGQMGVGGGGWGTYGGQSASGQYDWQY